MPRMAASRRKKPVPARNSSSGGDSGRSSVGSGDDDDDFTDSARPAKTVRRARPSGASQQRPSRIDLESAPSESVWPRLPTQPDRRHATSYHRPRMLDDGGKAIASLLHWFEGVSRKREMPWRQDWIDPSSMPVQEAARLLKVRAYQVWISEIMLQQTRVETVKGYWTNWMAKWPTIDSLASAKADEVLSAWRGLGYYSRATRLHTAAQKVVGDAELQGMLPDRPEDLERHVPGVGRYTSGAISSIVFGHAVPIVDGNVARVVSRQMALYANPKAKETTELLWHAAELLVRRASIQSDQVQESARQESAIPRSRIPGQWNQALMELGSTVCTPKPNCSECPIRTTCLAYAEGASLARREARKHTDMTAPLQLVDIEEICTACEPMPSVDEADEAASTAPPVVIKPNGTTARAVKRPLRQSTLSFGSGKANVVVSPSDEDRTEASASLSERERDRIAGYVKLFPMKAVKKMSRQEECLVCVVRRVAASAAKRKRGQTASPRWEYLVEQRPDTGLLASMWQFPSLTTVIEDGEERQDLFPSTSMETLSLQFASQVVRRSLDPQQQKQQQKQVEERIHHSASLGSVAHVFSHLKLLMHVHVVTLGPQGGGNATLPDLEADSATAAPTHAGKTSKSRTTHQQQPTQAKKKHFGTPMRYSAVGRWATAEEVEAESMGTGMRNCWALVLACK